MVFEEGMSCPEVPLLVFVYCKNNDMLHELEITQLRPRTAYIRVSHVGEHSRIPYRSVGRS